MSNIGMYDLVLVVAVSAQALVVAYIYRPAWKAFAFSLPIPFTFATLSLHQRVDATNALGILLLMAYFQAIRIFHQRLRVPIVLAIVTAALAYGGLAWAVADAIPRTDTAFFVALAVALAVATAYVVIHPHPEEPGHRTSLPIWVKLPVVAAVVILLVLVKHELRGFMTMFPMVGILAAYEARRCLWTFCRQAAIMGFCMAALMVISRLTEPRFGLAASLAFGWAAFLLVLFVLSRSLRNNKNEPATQRQPS